VKKFFLYIILALYGFSVTGMTIQFNYCCDELVGVELVPSNDHCDEENNVDACCKAIHVHPINDIPTTLKNDEVQKKIQVVLPSPQVLVVEPIIIPETVINDFPKVSDLFVYPRPLYLLHRVWLI
jgi:hypothetical protein